MKRYLSIFTLLICAFLSSPLDAEDIRAQIAADYRMAARNSCVYPEGRIQAPAAAPEGYVPVFIYHHARHGSRYNGNSDSLLVATMLEARRDGVLTDFGIDVTSRIEKYWKETDGCQWDLTRKGTAQHKAIAKRMYANYPSIFADSTLIDARSTVAFRSRLSMDAFCESLKEENPKLVARRISTPSYKEEFKLIKNDETKRFASSEGEWREGYKQLKKEYTTDGKRLASALFKDSSWLKARKMSTYSLAQKMMSIVASAQNIDCELDFSDIFTPEELYGFWAPSNYKFCMHYGACPESYGLMARSAAPIIKSMISQMDAALKAEKPFVTLRFSHDSFIGRIAAILKTEEGWTEATDPKVVCDSWNSNNVVPMACNIQFVFFRNEGNDVIVSVRLNERDANLPIGKVFGRFYKWEALRNYMEEVSR